MARGKKIIFELDAENTKLKRKLQQVEQQLDKAGKKGKSAFGTRIRAGFLAAAAAVTGLIIKLRDLVGITSEFDKGLRNVNSILGLSTGAFRDMRDEVLQVQAELGISSKDLTDALYQAVSAGVDAADAISFLRAAGKGAVGGVASVTESVDLLTTVLNAFHLQASESQRVTDILFQTIKLGKTNMSELAASMATVAPIAAANNIGFEEVAAAIASLTKQGTPTAQAVTQIRSAIIGMNKVLGDGWTATMTFQEGVKAVRDRAKGSQNALKDMLGRVEGVNAVLGLTGDNAQTAAEDLDAMRNSMGAANAAFQEQNKAIERRWDIFTSKFTAGMTRITNSVLDFLLPQEKLSAAIETEQANLNTLVGALADANEDEELRASLIRQINGLNPAFLKGLDTEKLTVEAIGERLKIANEEYAKRIALQIMNERKENALRQAAELMIERREKLKDINELYNKTLGDQADATLTLEEKVHALDRRLAATGDLDTRGRVLTRGKLLLLDYKDVTEEYTQAQKEAKAILRDVIELQKELTVTTETSGKKTGEQATTIDNAVRLISDSIDRLQTDLQNIPKVTEQSLGDSADGFEGYMARVEEETRRMENLGASLGASFTQGFDQEGLKGSLKQMLQTYLSYLESLVLIGEATGALRAIFGDVSAPVQVGLAIALLEAAKAGVASFRSGVTDFGGGVAKVHQGEVITNLPRGANVHTKQQAERLFDIDPLIREIRELRKDVQVLQSQKIVIKGYDLYVMYNRQKRLGMGRN